MRRPYRLMPLVALLIFLITTTPLARATTDDYRAAIFKTGDAIRAAFARGDVPAILSYHHPDVIKALGFNTLIHGRADLEAQIRGIFKNNSLEFVENRNESLLVNGDTAIEMTVFQIRVTPRNGNQPSLVNGRTMVVYVRYKPSPQGGPPSVNSSSPPPKTPDALCYAFERGNVIACSRSPKLCHPDRGSAKRTPAEGPAVKNLRGILLQGRAGLQPCYFGPQEKKGL